MMKLLFAPTPITLLGLLWCVGGIGPHAFCAPILSGSVTQNGPLFVYSYAIDNTSSPGPVREFSILIGDFGAFPVSHTEPPGWEFDIAGGALYNPINEIGEFWRWSLPTTGVGLPVGQSASGFSFTTTVGPTASTDNNYFVYCTTCAQGIIEFGHVVAPYSLFSPPPPPPVPEPSFFLPLLLLGLSLIGLRARGRFSPGLATPPDC